MNTSNFLSKTLKICSVTLLTGLLSVGTVSATDKPAIQFAPGKTSATVTGEIMGMDRDIYPIVAKAGQTMRVVVKNRYKLALFHIQLPGAEGKYLPKAGEEDDATSWEGKLPVDGKYLIIVGAMRGKDSKYSLQVDIK